METPQVKITVSSDAFDAAFPALKNLAEKAKQSTKAFRIAAAVMKAAQWAINPERIKSRLTIIRMYKHGRFFAGCDTERRRMKVENK